MYFKFYYFILEKLWEKFWISQVISRGTCHRHVTGHTTKEYKEQVKSRWTSKNFRSEFSLLKKRHPIQLSIWSVTCSSLVQEDMSHGIHKVIHKWNFFYGTEGYISILLSIFNLYSIWLNLAFIVAEKQW